MKINKSFKFRLYPTEKQEKLLACQFGTVRFVFNWGLRARIDCYAANKEAKKKGLNYFDTSRMLTVLKKNPEFSWLNESNSQALQMSLRHLDSAYQHFFKDKFQFPKFKKKSNKQSFTVPQHFSVDCGKNEIKIPKIGTLKVVAHRPIEGIVKSVTVSMVPSRKYFVSVLCEIEAKVKVKKTGGEIGIDLGLKSFAVTSKGENIDAPKFFRKSELRLARLQRLLSRKVNGSKNRNKARIKTARIYEKISNQRTDFLHKLSHRLVSENQAIFAEDLNVKGMMANHCLAKSVSDAGWSEFIRQLQYKSEWNGVHFGQIDRFFPSSKRCHACGWINESLTLKDREWTCNGCGAVVDRDLNAAQNILQFGKISVGRDAPEPKRPGRPHAVRWVAELGSPVL